LIRKITGDTSENYVRLAEESWNLPELFKSFEIWLNEHANNLPPKHEWIVDIGFSPRENANGGGPILSIELMQKCISFNMTIWLSEYSNDEE